MENLIKTRDIVKNLLNNYSMSDGVHSGLAEADGWLHDLEEEARANAQNTEILKQQTIALQEKCAGYEAALEHRDAKIVDVIQWIREGEFERSGGGGWVYGTDFWKPKTDAQLYDLYLNELRDNVKPE